MFLTIIIFGLILGVLIFVHELGHFMTARRNGVTAHEFGFGFPPRVVGVVKDAQGKRKIIFGNQEYFGSQTLYSLNLIPLGGFVRIKGENAVDEHDVKNFDKLSEADKEYVRMAHESDSFAVQSIWVRFKILVAGVAMNFVLAWLLISIVLMIGAPEPLESGSGDFAIRPFGIEIYERHNDESYDLSHIADGYVERTTGGKSVLFGTFIFDTDIEIKRITTLSLPTVMIESVQEDSVAKLAGMQIGDKILSVCEKNTPCIKIDNSAEFQKFIGMHAGVEIDAHVLRGKENVQLTITPKDHDGKGMIGVSMADITIVRYVWYEAFWESMMRVISLTIMIVSAFGALVLSIFTGGGVSADISGPVGIAMMTQQMRDMGFVYLLQFAAILSVNLGIINILPIPALDGGRIMFLVIEKFKGSPVNQRIEGIVHSAFFIALLVLMAVITVRDVVKLF